MLTTTIIIIFNISNIITMLVYLVLVFYCYIKKKKPLQKCVPEIKKEHLFTHDSAMWARQCFT